MPMFVAWCPTGLLFPCGYFLQRRKGLAPNGILWAISLSVHAEPRVVCAADWAIHSLSRENHPKQLFAFSSLSPDVLAKGSPQSLWARIERTFTPPLIFAAIAKNVNERILQHITCISIITNITAANSIQISTIGVEQQRHGFVHVGTHQYGYLLLVLFHVSLWDIIFLQR